MTSAVMDAGDDLPLTLPALWRQQVRKREDRVLLVCDETRLSYAAAEARSRRLARGLIAAGVTKGSHVALLYPFGADFLIGMLAAARIGATVLPFSTLSTGQELRGLLAHSDTAFLLAAAQFRSRRYDEALREALPELDFSSPPPLHAPTAPWLRRIWLSEPVPSGIEEGWTLHALEEAGSEIDDALLEAAEARVTPADRFVIIHTSGSTGTPKGVMHSHGTLIRHVDNGNRIRGFTADDILYSTAPFFWVAGFAFALLGTLIAGARIVCSNAIDPADVLDLLERERPTTTNGYGATVAKLASHPSFPRRDLSSIRHGTLYPILAPHVRPKDPELRHSIYGMSETGGALTMCADESDLPEQQRGACGRFMPGFEARIIDPETRRERAAGEMGELWIRGPFLMEGYYGKSRSQIFEADGWFRTGDIGLIDPNGLFYIKGRLDDMIKTAGANVAPREVENVLRQLSGGRQWLVLGLPDPERGQIVTAVLIGDQERELNEAALIPQLGKALSSYKVPRRFCRLSERELPLQSSGKLDMRRLKEIVSERIRTT